MWESTIEPPLVSVIVPARDAEPTLEKTLEALRGQWLAGPYEVLLVDDGSRDRTIEIAAGFEPWLTVIRSPDSEGPGAARNRGAAAARAPILAFTDSDCFPTPGWLSEGLRALAGGADLVQGAVEPDPNIPRTPFDRTVIVRAETGLYPTANLFVRRATFEATGGFHDWVLAAEGRNGRRRRRPIDRRRQRATRTPIGEDTIFGWRSRRLGARTAFAPLALVHHAVVPGSVWDQVLDNWHWARDMAGLTRLVPELRDAFFYRNWFFSPKTFQFDLAVTSVVLAALAQRRLPLLGAAPYATWLLREALSQPVNAAVRHVFGWIVADGVTFAGLVVGSTASRCVVL